MAAVTVGLGASVCPECSAGQRAHRTEAVGERGAWVLKSASVPTEGFCEDTRCLLQLCYENKTSPNFWHRYLTGGNENSKVGVEDECDEKNF